MIVDKSSSQKQTIYISFYEVIELKIWFINRNKKAYIYNKVYKGGEMGEY